MKIRPVRTIGRRLQLRQLARKNAGSRRRIAAQAVRFEEWANSGVRRHPDSTLEALIHPYPGIGHQLAGWISGDLWARDLGLPFSGGTLTQDDHDVFAFPKAGGRGEKTKVVHLTSVNDESDPRSLTVLRGQVNRASAKWPGQRIQFRLALDQPRWDQTQASASVRAAVLNGSQGQLLRVLESDSAPYIALHVRRGDVGIGAAGGSTGHSRWVDESWYVELVRRLRENPHLTDMDVRAYALGSASDFPALAKEGVELHLGGERDADFIELCAARVLVAAPSSFSFTAGLASRGVVVAQWPWWHNVPNEGRWVRASVAGTFLAADLSRAIGDLSS
jgi:hypothetical protein